MRRWSASFLLACAPLAACVGSEAPEVVHAGARGALHQTWEAPGLARTSVPGSWQLAAAVEDWPQTAQRIDALLEAERNEPGTRYVRAVAAVRMGESVQALALSDGLAEQLPAVEEEIAALRAESQLDVGPFEAAAAYYSSRQSPWEWLRAARAWQRAERWSLARRQVERVLASPRLQRALKKEARTLRAELAEQSGDWNLARDDYHWLAVETASPAADTAYERVAGRPLTKLERLSRAEVFAMRGQVDRARRELERSKHAPGKAPVASARARCLARAYYRSRTDYPGAARLFEQLARQRGGEVSDWFHAAEAWSRGGQLERAALLYEKIVRRDPNGAAAERARYLAARLHYGHGLWEEADQAYTRYLLRYARHGSKGQGRFVDASRYERVVSRLAAGHSESALRGLARLRDAGGGGYPRSLLQHLEAVALVSSSSTAKQALAVARFEEVIREHPFSFGALASSARLMQLGRPLPEGDLPPAPASLRQTMIELPTQVRQLAELGLYSAAERALHSQQRDLLRLYHPRSGETLCQQYGALDRGFRRYALARAVTRRGGLRTPPTASNLWAWQCLYPRPFASAVAGLESRYGLPSGLIHSVMRQESEFRPDARSAAGAVGLMQLMPATAERAARELALSYQRDRLEHPQYNLHLGAFYLSKLLDSFDRRVVLALASYNAGPRAVARWLEGSNLSLDLWVARIPYRETRGYVQNVMSNWARYRYLAAGPGAVPKFPLRAPVGVELSASVY